jgi:hypothetical protein
MSIIATPSAPNPVAMATPLPPFQDLLGRAFFKQGGDGFEPVGILDCKRERLAEIHIVLRLNSDGFALLYVDCGPAKPAELFFERDDLAYDRDGGRLDLDRRRFARLLAQARERVERG